MPQSDRILPRDPEGSAVDLAADAVEWEYDTTIEPDPEGEIPEEHIYLDPETRASSLHHVIDPQSGLSFVVLDGDWTPEQERTVRKEVDAYTVDEAEAELREAKGEKKVDSVYRLGILAPSREDARIRDLLVEAMHDEDRAVRLAAVWATAYSAWKAFESPLAELRGGDPDAEVREDAGIILAAMKEAAEQGG